MEDREIIQLYWDRDEQAILATAEKYGGYTLEELRRRLSGAADFASGGDSNG